jgi:hypothetical protein
MMCLVACSGTNMARSTVLPDAAALDLSDASPAPSAKVVIQPASPTIALGTTQQFVAIVAGATGTNVGWRVQEGAGCGTIDGTGLYSPPMSLPAGACHVVATLQSDATASGSTVIHLVKAGNPGQACAAEPLRSTGQIHYVCDCQSGANSKCVAGSDNNPGTSPSAPLQTFAKAVDTFSKMNAGDTVALCRGGKWTGRGGTLANTNCNKDSTCDLRDYAPPWGDGSEALPSLWISGGSNGATLISFTHESAHYEGYRVLNLDMHGASADTALFFWNETTDVDLCNLSMDGFNISVNMSGGDQPTFGTPANIVLRGSRITNNTNIGYIAVCDYCSVEDSYFDNDGVRDSSTHSVYFASQAWKVNGQQVVHTSKGMRLSRNEIHHTTQQCNGAPVVVHGRHQDVVIEGNVVDAVSSTDGCWGPGVGCGGYEYGCWYRNTIIRGNTLKGLGNVGSDNSNCVGCLIENNVIVISKSGNAISLGGDKPRPAGDPTYTRWDGSPDDPTNNVTVRNNTLYFTADATSGKGINVASGTGHTLEGNAIYFAVTKAGLSDNLCYSLPANPTTVLAGADYNVCKIPADAHWMDNPPDYAGMNLSAWQSASGFEKHSKMTDPMFTNAPADFTPASASPLVNAGDPANSPTVDVTGKTRDSQPDIGAVER